MERIREAIDVGFQDGVEVGIDHRGVAAGDDFHEGAGAVGDADLAEAGGTRDVFDSLFVRWIGVAVQEADGERFDAGGFEAGELFVDL